MDRLRIYLEQFSHLSRAPGPIWTEATKRKAPHKPILLLAVLDLVDRQAITAPFVDITGNVVELNELFTLYWRRIMGLGQSSSIAFPFSRLNREPFWKLVPKPGQTILPAMINNTSSISYLEKYAVGARLDGGLFTVMQTGPGNDALREALLQTCFSTEAQVQLREQSVINREASAYSRILEQKSHLPLVKEIVEEYQFRSAARDQGFRRLVVSTYNHRCALCGIRIVTPDGHTVVEAAHIIPWSKTRNDDIRNGIALCRTCHWGFDEGMLAVSDDYTVVTSRSIGTDPNFPGLLSMLRGRHIIPPAERDHWPAPEYLAEHRRQWNM